MHTLPAGFQDSGVISSIWLGSMLHILLRNSGSVYYKLCFLEDEHSVIKKYQNGDCNQCIVFTAAGLDGYLVNGGGFVVSPPVMLQCQGLLSLVVVFIWWWPYSSWRQRFYAAASALDKLSAWIYEFWFPPSPRHDMWQMPLLALKQNLF